MMGKSRSKSGRHRRQKPQLNGQDLEDQVLIQALEIMTKRYERKRSSGFPFNLAEKAIGLCLNALEKGIGKLVAAVLKAPKRR